MKALLPSLVLGTCSLNLAIKSGMLIPVEGMAVLISSAVGMGTGLPAREPIGVALPGDPGVERGLSVMGRVRLSVSVSLPEPARRPMGEVAPDISWRCCFFMRLWFIDSLPLVSDRLGEPGRLRLDIDGFGWRPPPCFSARPDGVLVLVDIWEACLSSLALSSSSFLRSSSSR
jgi:hypothetical protein